MERIYLDANATTPVLPEVFEAMRPLFTERFGNPSSAHAAGQRTRAAVEHARAAVAGLLGCTAKEMVFTSGGTEGNNLALRGVLDRLLPTTHDPHPETRSRPSRPHLITTAIEHHAVLYPAQELEARGCDVTYLAPTHDGIIDPATFEAALTPHTRLVTVMLANNETGAVQPIGKLARVAKQFNPAILVHTDAVQAAGKLPLDLAGEFKNVDLLTISGHKMYAPQGTGALFVRKGVQLAPLFHGGPHERGRRAGTENVPGIVGLGRAAECAREWLDPKPGTQDPTPDRNPAPGPHQLEYLRNRLESGLLAAVEGTHLNTATAPRTPNTTNLRFDGCDAEALLIALDIAGVAASFGAACQSGATEPSHVLLAMGLTPAQARSSLRFSLSRLTTRNEIDRALEIIPAVVARSRSLRASPTLARVLASTLSS